MDGASGGVSEVTGGAPSAPPWAYVGRGPDPVASRRGDAAAAGALRSQRVLVPGAPTGRTDTVVVGDVSPAALATGFGTCTPVTRLRSPAGVHDQTGAPVRWCTGRLEPWSVPWPQLQTLG